MVNEIIRNLEIFHGLPDSVLEMIEKKMSLKEYKRDDIIVEEGTEGAVLYIVLSGLVQVMKAKEDEAFKTLAILKSGDFFGEMSLIDNSPRSATVKAVTDVTVYEFEKDDFLKMKEEDFDSYFALYENITLTICKRLRKMNSEFLRINSPHGML